VLMLVRRLPALALLLCALLCAAPVFAKSGVAAIWEPGKYNQLEVFFSDHSGAIHEIKKGSDYYWHQPSYVTPSGWAVPGGEVLALWQTLNDQLEVFWVDGAGALGVQWKDHDSQWRGPAKLTGPGFAAPGSPLAGFWQPTYHQLHVFGITTDGAIDMLYKTDNGKWSAPTRMTGPGAAVPGSQPVAIYQPTGGESQLFYTGSDGSVNLLWKPYNEKWRPPFAIAGPGTAAPGAWLTGLYYAPYDQLEIFYTNPAGAVNVTWKHGENIFAWNTQTITGANFSAPGAPITSGYIPADNHLEVFSTGGLGTVNDVWKQNNGGWAPAFNTTPTGSVPPGNTLSAATLPNPLQLEVFYRDANGAIWDTWKKGNEPWRPPVQLTGDGGQSIISKDYCLAYWRDWYNGRRSVSAGMAMDCKPYASDVCRYWHMTAPPLYIFNDNNMYILLNHSRTRDPDFPTTYQELVDANGDNSFGGPVNWYKGAIGGNNDGAGGGQILSGKFNVYSGLIRFSLRLDKERRGDAGFPIEVYNGSLDEIYHSPDTRGVYASTRGLFTAMNGKPFGSWRAPVPNSDRPPAVYCAESDLMIKDTPPGPARDRIPQIPVKPKPGAYASFAGEWVTRSGDRTYTMRLKQDAAGNVTGDYGAGTISKGVVVDRDLYAVWTQGASSGTLMYHLAPDGTTFAGVWQDKDTITKPVQGNITGIWDGYSKAKYGPIDKTGAFNGSFLLDKNPGERVDLNITTRNGKFGGSFPGGAFLGNVISFKGHPTELVGDFTLGKDIFGKGSLFLYPDGKGFSGFWHSGLASSYAWSGWFQAPPSANVDDLVQYGGCSSCNSDPNAPAPAAVQPTPPREPPPSQPPVVLAAPPAAPVVVTPPPKQIVLPQGQCPAPAATATSALNIRLGSNGDIVAQVAKGSRLQCLACDQNWCLIGSNNPNSTVSRKLLQFDTPQPTETTATPPAVEPTPPQQAKAPVQPKPEPKPASEPAPAPEVANFDGHWNVFTSTGLVEQFELHQQGVVVVGGFTDTYGTSAQVNGAVSGRTLTLQWANNRGYTGVGTFTMHDDKQSFDGRFGVNTIPPFQQISNYANGGTWQTFVPEQASPDDLTMYGGCSSCNDAPSNVVK